MAAAPAEAAKPAVTPAAAPASKPAAAAAPKKGFFDKLADAIFGKR